MITRISFVRPINVAGKDLASYSATRDVDIMIKPQGNVYVFTRKGYPKDSTEVPITSMIDIGKQIDDEPAPAPVQGKAK